MRARVKERIGRLGEESGLTIIEVLIASIVLVLGAAASFGILSTATKNAQRAKATQVALDLAQEEVERLRGVPYAGLALSFAPSESSNPLDPNHRVVAGSFALQKQPPDEFEPLVVADPGRGISPESPFDVGGPSGITGTVYRYVVWRDDPECPEEQCPGEQDYKQVVVAVKPDKPGNQAAERGYVEIQSEVVDPDSLLGAPGREEEEEEEEEPEPREGEGDVTAQQFFLSDTPCAEGGATVREEIVADHLLHNTLGTCASGPQTGSTPGAPDALLLGAPPDPDPADEFNPLLYDYSDDFYLEPTPDTDKGVQIRRDDTSGCHFDPTGSSNPESQAHRWVTDPLEAAFGMTEKATLEFSTRTLNDALHTGTVCVYLFRRHEEGLPPIATDTLLDNAAGGADHWTYTPEGNGFWPRFAWAKVRLTMLLEDAPYTISADDRLGVALSVERANTPADAIPIMYDHPNYPTRIEVDTDTPIEGG